MATKTYEYRRPYVRKDGTITVMTVKQHYVPRKKVIAVDPMTQDVLEQYKRHYSGLQIAKMLEISYARVMKIINKNPNVERYDIATLNALK